MPELPEVETVKKVLEKVVISHKIIAIDVLRNSIIDGDITTFKNALINQTFLEIERKGKFLIFHLSNDVSFLSHLRMEGKYYEIDEHLPNSKYARVVFHLDNGKKVCYDDSRTFGKMKLTNKEQYLKEKEIAKLGKEPFDIEDVTFLLKRTKNLKKAIKTTLLDQTLITGLGNIYVDEVLFKSNIHPLTPACLITKEEWVKIVTNSKETLSSAIKAGGSTIKSYHPGKDISGNFQTSLVAYGRSNEKCVNCNSVMRFIKVNGRGTTYCPHCQVRKGENIKVAITGKIASGKSSVLDIFKANGYPVISSDEIVRKLYSQKEVINKINKAFDLKFNKEIDRNVLRDYLLNNPNKINQLNKIVWPLVKQEIIKFFKEENNKLQVVEVPLLYESKMENLFDYIIAIDIDPSLQYKRIELRDGKKANDLKIINANSNFDKNKEKTDIVINNNFDLKTLNKNIKEIIKKLINR